MKLTHRIAIVTGGRAGIGFAIARLFASEGATVILVGRSEAVQESSEKLRAEGLDVHSVVANLGDEKAVASLMEFVVERFGVLDILVNNAGVAGIGKIEDISLMDWEDVMRNNLTTAFLCCKYALPIMKKRGSGAIVNISSIAGRAFSQVAGVHYTSSKAGLLGLTRQLAWEEAAHGIRVNAIAPSQTNTEMLQKGLEISNKTISEIAEKIPLGRVADPREIATVCLYLCSDASAYVTGTTVDVNGGLF